MNPIIALLTATIISTVITLPTIYLAQKFHLVTDKRKRSHPAHTHTGIIPRGGGVPIYLALLISSLIFLPISKITTGILFGASLLVLVGLIDDFFDISPYFRFITNIGISAIVVGFGLGIPYISNPLGGVIRLDTIVLSFSLFGYHHHILLIADILAIIWLSAMMNAINWSKGVDGQLPGFVAISALCMGLLAQRFTHYDISAQAVTIFAFITAGAFLGFLPWNFYPQKIMPGYGGGSLAGFLLGVLSILSFGKVGTAILVLAVPLLDAAYTILRRVVQKKSPFKADWGHFHHRLLEIGWGRRRIAVFYWVIALLLGIASLVFNGWEKVLVLMLVAVILGVFTIIMGTVKQRE